MLCVIIIIIILQEKKSMQFMEFLLAPVKYL